MTGKLVVVATPIGNLGDLSPRAIEALATADVVACEDTRHLCKLFTATGTPAPRLLAVHKDNEDQRCAEIVGLVADGQVVALITDAGTPGVSDPGRRVVEAVSAAGHVVESIPGPSAVTTALAASGLVADRFVFEGFLPRKGPDRKARLASIAAEERTVVIYESPNRVSATLRDLAAAGGTDRVVVVARELTKLHEEIWRGTLADAATRFAATRGEFVLVIEGAAHEIVEADDDAVLAALDAARARGLSTRAASDAVATSLGITRNRAYRLAVRSSKPNDKG